MSMVEVSVRLFYTSGEEDVCPRITVLLPEENFASASTDWTALIGLVREQVKGIPIDNLREMEPAEVKEYRAAEAKEAGNA